jgi:hypothetical protein
MSNVTCQWYGCQCQAVSNRYSSYSSCIYHLKIKFSITNSNSKQSLYIINWTFDTWEMSLFSAHLPANAMTASSPAFVSNLVQKYNYPLCHNKNASRLNHERFMIILFNYGGLSTAQKPLNTLEKHTVYCSYLLFWSVSPQLTRRNCNNYGQNNKRRVGSIPLFRAGVMVSRDGKHIKRRSLPPISLAFLLFSHFYFT